MGLLVSLEVGRSQVDQVRHLLQQGPCHVHLVGIAGIGMAGVAYHLAARGFHVTGCDLASNRVSDWLDTKGIPVAIGHDAAHIGSDVAWVIRSTAVPDSNPELGEARRRGIPVFGRGVVLPALLHGKVSIAVSGTHGKTTTSTMIAELLESGGLHPGFCVGGEVAALGGVAGGGDSHIMVVEADESDGTIMLYEPDIAVITNIEYDHMEHFEQEETLIRCFEVFAGNARRVIFCADDPRASTVGHALPRIRSYGFSKQADLQGQDIVETGTSVRMIVSFKDKRLGELSLPVPGRHNAQNALAACAVAMEMGMTFDQVREGLQKFTHARRRFEKVYDNKVLVISDYAHHPTEIAALVRTSLQLRRPQVIGVFQPHRYTRTLALGKDFPPAFAGLDELILVPVYEASESPIPGGTSQDLYRHFREYGLVPVKYIESLSDAWKYTRGILKEGDVLLVIGAGDVEQVAFWAKDELGTIGL